MNTCNKLFYFFGFFTTVMLFNLVACTSQPTSTSTVTEKPNYIQLAERDALLIGQKIWMNESSGRLEGLTAWNKGESFASLGIAHFIWYPRAQEGRFKETFPALFAFLREQGITLTEEEKWLGNTPDCPWNSRDEFIRDFQTAKMKSLRDFMFRTIPQQVQFLINRLEAALPALLNTLSGEQQREQIRQQFYRIAQTPQGVYALMDYVNFKGEGTVATERYQGQGWGLLQVLESMPVNPIGNPVVEFANAAELVLKRRIQNSPKANNEARWWEGWKNRLETYRQ